MTSLAAPEARALEMVCRRQLAWERGMAARVVTTARALGVFTVPPLGVLAFVAVPHRAAEPGQDVTVPLGVLADALRDSPGALDLAGLPRAIVPPSPAPSLGHLPPSDGWQLPMHAIAGDLMPMVDAATREFAERSAGLPKDEQEAVAEDIWARPGFGGMPVRGLHAARQLGMIGDDSARVAVATNGQWRRLSTSRGQVFTYANGPAARLALRLVT